MPMRVAKAVTAVRAGAQMPTGGQGEGAVGGDVAHEDTVYHAVQNIEKLRQHSGQAQAQDQFGDGDSVKFSFHRHTSFEKISPIG